VQALVTAGEGDIDNNLKLPDLLFSSLVSKLILLTTPVVYSLMLILGGLELPERKEESLLLVGTSYLGLNWQL